MELEYQIKKYQNKLFEYSKDIEFVKIYQCVCCNSSDLQILAILKNSIETCQCKNCGHIFHNKTLSNKFLNNWYKKNFALSNKRTNNKVLNNIGLNWKGRLFQNLLFGSPAILYDQIGFLVFKLINKNSNVLDIGTGYGKRLKQFKKFGAKTFGIEPSLERCNFAKKIGLNVKNILIDDLSLETFNKKFDLIYSHHVLEHIPYPQKFFENILKVIKPNGYLCIAVPNVESEFMLHNFFFAPHCNFFSSFSLNNLANKYNFKLLKVIKEHQIVMLFQYIKDIKLDNKYYSTQLVDSKKFSLFDFNKTYSSIFNESYNNKNIQKDIFWKSSNKKLHGNFEIKYNIKNNNNFNHIYINSLDTKKSLPFKFIDINNSFSSFWIK